jgi:hypothetical protein
MQTLRRSLPSLSLIAALLLTASRRADATPVVPRHGRDRGGASGRSGMSVTAPAQPGTYALTSKMDRMR